MLHWLRALWYACHASMVTERFAAAKSWCFCRESLCSVEFIHILFFRQTVIAFFGHGPYLFRISRKTPCQADHAGSTSRVPWIASNSGAAESTSVKPGQSACSKSGKIRERGLFVHLKSSWPRHRVPRRSLALQHSQCTARPARPRPYLTAAGRDDDTHQRFPEVSWRKRASGEDLAHTCTTPQRCRPPKEIFLTVGFVKTLRLQQWRRKRPVCLCKGRMKTRSLYWHGRGLGFAVTTTRLSCGCRP